MRPRRPEDLYAPVTGHPVETIANLDAIPIRENGEPMIDLRVACVKDVRVRPLSGLPGGKLIARVAVANRINDAQAYLNTHHPGYRLVIVDAYRAGARQKRMHYTLRLILRLLHPTWPNALIREAANKFVAAPDALAPAPHTTGGAVDVRLQDPNGLNATMGNGLTDSHADYARLSPAAAHNRQILRDAMNAAGFSNYEEEWWHWSYGDSGWALRSNQPHALYGATS